MKSRWAQFIGGLILGIFPFGWAAAASLEVFHADSLAGPMQELKKAFEGKNQGVTLNLGCRNSASFEPCWIPGFWYVVG